MPPRHRTGKEMSSFQKMMLRDSNKQVFLLPDTPHCLLCLRFRIALPIPHVHLIASLQAHLYTPNVHTLIYSYSQVLSPVGPVRS